MSDDDKLGQNLLPLEMAVVVVFAHDGKEMC